MTKPVTSASGASATQTVNPPAVVTSTATTSVARGRASAGTGHPSPLTGLGDICSEHEQLGLHVPVEVREKIWKGAYIDIFDLLVDKAENEEVRRCKECAHSRECGHGPQRRRVEESLSNWVRAFSIYQAILAERFSGLTAQLACYQNWIVGAHDEYGGTAWKEYDNEFRRIKAYKPSLAWDQIHIITWLHYTNCTQGPGQQPFHGPAGMGSGASGGTGAKKGACWDFNRRTCSRSPGTCRFKHCCSFCGQASHPEFKCFKKSRDKGAKKQD
ncbi:hypothetical protein NDU88_005024 [Pleurodeles waltl]|uniref:C3H1-type domain-containing protein n=1 Tax=Pleurodeles waltl TaxID=8319 RepID=A0AAV7RML9_PLEWA|nr:hypothetical protein NDU88_005024 [Pleurodeles waltl]